MFQLSKGILDDLLSIVLLPKLLGFLACQEYIKTVPQDVVVYSHRLVVFRATIE
ncbi:hypothetical protein VOA_002276 [Vibrio sp. RC586]|nr:hypothetical protein VOA_002276 [Vibrio sp. RC586]